MIGEDVGISLQCASTQLHIIANFRITINFGYGQFNNSLRTVPRSQLIKKQEKLVSTDANIIHEEVYCS